MVGEVVFVFKVLLLQGWLLVVMAVAVLIVNGYNRR